jgi:hypothetical protein
MRKINKIVEGEMIKQKKEKTEEDKEWRKLMKNGGEREKEKIKQ